MKINHYKWLEKHFPAFAYKVGLRGWTSESQASGILAAHGDKCYGYKYTWEKAGIEFPHGVAIYLLTYEKPFWDEVRETKDGWVSPLEWVITNKDRFLPHLPPVDPNDSDVCDDW